MSQVSSSEFCPVGPSLYLLFKVIVSASLQEYELHWWTRLPGSCESTGIGRTAGRPVRPGLGMRPELSHESATTRRPQGADQPYPPVRRPYRAVARSTGPETRTRYERHRSLPFRAQASAAEAVAAFRDRSPATRWCGRDTPRPPGLDPGTEDPRAAPTPKRPFHRYADHILHRKAPIFGLFVHIFLYFQPGIPYY